MDILDGITITSRMMQQKLVDVLEKNKIYSNKTENDSKFTDEYNFSQLSEIISD